MIVVEHESLRAVAREIIAAGYFISATPASEYHDEHRQAIRETPLENLLLETDCPVWYGRETKYQSRPADIARSLRAVAEIKVFDVAIVANRTTRNAIELFGEPDAGCGGPAGGLSPREGSSRDR